LAISTSTHATRSGRRHLALLSDHHSQRTDESRFETAYWLAHCEGYRVDADEGRIGFVEEVRLGPDHPTDTVLAVRTGRLGRRIMLVPATETAFIVPRAERIWLRSPVAIAGSEPE
jgi:hypothetical protein